MEFVWQELRRLKYGLVQMLTDYPYTMLHARMLIQYVDIIGSLGRLVQRIYDA